MSEMLWSKDPPSEPGWYWWRREAGQDEFPREVHEASGRLWVEDLIGVCDDLVEREPGEWQGPITPQEGAE